ncbi:MAG: DNA topoisomerase IV subunit A [Pontiellaceae bacterium]|jgi:topoisomerase-4 subunit A|nr:DNA topoisomerase IV subunit A [Pontiellaceae bacterium]
MSEEQEQLFGGEPEEKKPAKKSAVKKPAAEDDDELPGDLPESPQGSRKRFALDSDHGPLRQLVDYNFLQYASYVICDRAIPNVEDGLKPVQRRIMHALSEKDDGRFIKVANVVGHTMQYHPHGDASINDALVSLANRGGYLIEGQGNFGNIYTGDPAAAARYIECRLTPLAREELFNKELTRYIPSYDGRNKEPVVLPCKLPLLLMLGAEGIAVGLSTKILTYNFIELLQEQIEILREKKREPHKCTVLPDFQTGGLMDVSEYNNGIGKVKVRAKIEERNGNRLVITDLPYGQTTETLTSSIEDAVRKKKVAVRAINDFTAENVEIELVLSPGADLEQVRQSLYVFTSCETPVSSRIVVIYKNRPVEMTVDEILHLNTQQLLIILEAELNFKKDKLLDAFHTKTLVQIFVENRIYKKIEQCKTYEAVRQAVLDGLKPFLHLLRRPVADDDIEMLLAIQIKRISLFDINRNKDEIAKILTELAEVEKNLGGLTAYATRYLKELIKKYKEFYPRRTEIRTFKEIEVRELTASELDIRRDTESQFVGSAIKGESLMKCSSLDKLIFVWNDGRYQMMPPPEKLFVDSNLLYCAIFDRDREMTCVYTHERATFIKRFTFGGTIMNRDYQIAPEGAKIIFWQEGCPDELYLRYRPAKGQRIHQQSFSLKDLAVKGSKAKGNRLTTKSVQYIDTRPGRWWRDDEESPVGVLI